MPEEARGRAPTCTRPAPAAGPRREPLFPATGRPAAGICFLLLALALSSLFVGRYDTDHLHHNRAFHNHDSVKNLLLAANLSFEHRLLLFKRTWQTPDGKTYFETYSRFPIGGYALIKLSMLPFEGDPTAQIVAARMLMLALFCAAAALAWDALRRIVADPWAALAATLLAFSSLNLLRWSDMVSTEAMIDLTGIFLVFHGMVLRWQGRGWSQLMAKTCVALLLGWHVVALLLPYVTIGVAVESARAWRRPGPRTSLGAAALALVRSRHLALPLVAIVFGAAVLGFNLANEHAAYGGDRALAALPTVQSVQKRLGFDPSYTAATAKKLAWPRFLEDQLRRIANAMLPNALTDGRTGRCCAADARLGALALAACLGLLLLVPMAPGARALLATLALFGLAWALPMRHNTAYHDFEALHYVGMPLTLFVLSFTTIRKLNGGRGVTAVAALAAVPLFVVSAAAARHSGWHQDAESWRKTLAQRTTLEELGGIRATTVGRTAFVAYDADLASPAGFDNADIPDYAGFALAGTLLRDDGWGRRRTQGRSRMRTAAAPRPGPAPGHYAERDAVYDFIVVVAHTELAELERNAADPALLTPGNRFALLYDGAAFATVHDFYRHWFRWQYRALAARRPTARSAFDVYLLAPRGYGHELAYRKAACSEADVLGGFFVHVVPKDERSLPSARRQYGFDNLDFRFDRHGTFVDGWCMARILLPEYDWLRVSTGRYTENEGEIWRTTIDIGDLRPTGP